MGWLSGVGIATTGDFYGPDAGASQFQSDVGGGTNPGIGTTTNSALSRDAQDSAPAIQSKQLLPSLKGINPLLWIPLILGSIVCLRILREWGSQEGEVKEARAGLYFGAMATLWTIALTPLCKAFLQKYHVPGLSEYVQNA